MLLNSTYGTVDSRPAAGGGVTLNRLQALATLPLLDVGRLRVRRRLADRRRHASFRARWRSAPPATRRWPTRRAGSPREESRAIGVHVNFAPVADVNNNPRNPVINTRSFGEDPARVGALAAAFVRGLQAGGVLATLKHFPGHGDTDVDSHLGLPIIRSPRARLDAVELPPFSAGDRRRRRRHDDRAHRAAGARSRASSPADAERSRS